MAKRWQRTELAYLERNVGSLSIDELAQRFNTDPATVTTKIKELGLGVGPPGAEAALGDYETGLRAMYGGDLERAATAFEAVIAETDSRQLRALARQHLAACHSRLAARDNAAETDPYLTAVFEKNRGNLAAARDLVDGRTGGDERFSFLAASIHALLGDEKRALGLLEDAIRLEPKNRVHAFNDPDFASLRGTEGFDALVRHR